MAKKTQKKKKEKPKKKNTLPAKKAKKSRVRIVKKAKVSSQKPPKKKKGGRGLKMNKIWVEELLGEAGVRRWLVQHIGEHAIHVIREFEKEMSDEEIAKKADIRASDVRVVLNRLHSHGLASYLRKRDKNSGWYSYIWKLDQKHAQELLDGIQTIEQDQVAAAGGSQELYYSIVGGKKRIYTFEQAFENNFKCPITGQSLKYLEANKIK